MKRLVSYFIFSRVPLALVASALLLGHLPHVAVAAHMVVIWLMLFAVSRIVNMLVRATTTSYRTYRNIFGLRVLLTGAMAGCFALLFGLLFPKAGIFSAYSGLSVTMANMVVITGSWAAVNVAWWLLNRIRMMTRIIRIHRANQSPHTEFIRKTFPNRVENFRSKRSFPPLADILAIRTGPRHFKIYTNDGPHVYAGSPSRATQVFEQTTGLRVDKHLWVRPDSINDCKSDKRGYRLVFENGLSIAIPRHKKSGKAIKRLIKLDQFDSMQQRQHAS